MSALLQVNNLTIRFSHQDRETHRWVDTVNDVGFSIGRGETTALVGESGSGKTITALSILRLLETISTVDYSGAILFEGKDLLALPQDDLRAVRGNDIAMIFQEPMTSLNPVYTIGNQLIEPLLLHRGMTQAEALAEAVELLSITGIPNPRERLDSYPHQLSGGQRQRVMIAMAIACRPQLLIADEPTTALDVTVQAQILALLKKLQAEFGMAILLITHNLPLVREIADTVCIMSQGRIIEQGATAGLFAAPGHSYTRKLLHSIPAANPQPKSGGTALLQAQGLRCRFSLKGTRKSLFSRAVKVVNAVDNVDLAIPGGTTCGIVGESGSGKTTLGLALLRLIPSTGTIRFDGQRLDTMRSRQIRPLRSQMQLVFQDPFSSLSPRLTIEDIVAEGVKVHLPEIPTRQRREMVAAILEEVGLDAAMARRYPHEFSGGQRQRIAIARAVILKPKFLVLDEPTSALDMTIQAQIIDLLRDLQQKYAMTYLFISHDLRVVRAMADQVVVLQNGAIVEAGPAGEIFTSPSQDYTRKLFSAAFSEPAPD